MPECKEPPLKSVAPAVNHLVTNDGAWRSISNTDEQAATGDQWNSIASRGMITLHYFILIKKYEIIFDRIKYLIMLKSNISDFFFSRIYKNQHWFRQWF